MSSEAPVKRLHQALLKHIDNCEETDKAITQLRCVVDEQQQEIEDGRAEEASLARLEESLEDTTSALSDAVAEVQRLKRDLSSVESELGAVSRDKSKAQGEVKRLAQQLASEEAVKRSMKRKLDAFTSGSSSGGGLLLGDGGGGGMGAVIAGLQLQHLDLAECVCEVRNATNMDVSLAGWTVRVVADASLVVETAGPDGSVRVRSPAQGKGAGRRRDSDVARRHAFHFPFDFMLAAGSCAVVRWGPEYTPLSEADANTFTWQRPYDFDASDVVSVAIHGIDDEAGESSSSSSSGGGAGDLGAGNDEPMGGLSSPYSRAGARLGGWNTDTANDPDPDAALKAGALCLVDPEGAVTHAVRLLNPEGGDDEYGNGGSDGYGAQDSHYANNASSSSSSSTYGAAADYGGESRRRRVSYAVESSGNAMSPWAASGSPYASEESFWHGAAAAAMATPRRLGERFAAAMEPSGRRWGGRNGGRPITTPLPEPAVPDKCAIM